jgi:peptide/nickel transport system substrate-binding protein
MAPNTLPSVSPKTKVKALAILSAFLVALVLVLSACGGGSTTQSTTTHKSVLSIGTQVGADFTKAFSPYNTSPDSGIQGMVYETLYFFDRANSTSIPWLATSYQWSSDYKQLTFTIRQGVKWSDGQPFSANDVAFTFNMLKQYPAADLNALWSYFSSVTAPDANTVVISFQKPYPPILWYVAGQTYIVPQHIFSSAGDPTKFVDDPPIGTGPFKLTKFSPSLLIYDRNPGYWQASSVKVDELQYPSVKDNNTLQLKLMAGQIDWGSFFAPDLNSTFVAKDPAHNHYWMAPTDMFTLYVNLTKYPFNLVSVRQAISAALDRQQMANQAESGYVAPASTTGLILPNQQSYLDPSLASTPTSPNTAKAISLLQSAGFTRGSDGIFADKNGKKLSFKLNVVSGWTDWETMTQIIKQNLSSIGIQVTINDISFDAYAAARANAGFDMMIGGLFGGPSPFYLYNTHLNSANLSPTGYNWGRWKDPTTDQLLQQYATTTDQTVQMQAIHGIEKIYQTELPNIPLVNAASWYEYSTKNFTGWPDQNHPYAVGAAYSAPDNVVIITHLTPAA